MGLMDASAWTGKIFVGGAWVPGSGGDYAVIEPAPSSGAWGRRLPPT